MRQFLATFVQGIAEADGFMEHTIYLYLCFKGNFSNEVERQMAALPRTRIVLQLLRHFLATLVQGRAEADGCLEHTLSFCFEGNFRTCMRQGQMTGSSMLTRSGSQSTEILTARPEHIKADINHPFLSKS